MRLYEKLNLKNTIKSHLETFKGQKGSYVSSELIGFLYIPISIALFLALLKFPDKGILDTFAICISVLIGLLLNLLVLILSNISGKSLDITNATKKIRIELIEETFHNISFAIILCIVTLITLFLFNLDFELLKTLREYLIGRLSIVAVKYVLSFILYFLLIQVFLHLFMIIKRISTIFAKDIEWYKTDMHS